MVQDPFKPHDPKENPTAFAQGKDPRFPQVPKETLTVPQPAPFHPATNAEVEAEKAKIKATPALSAAQQQANIDAQAAQDKAKAAVAVEQKTASERKVKVKLLNDVWIEDPGHEDAGKDGIRRIRTNIPVLDEHGNPKVDPKSKAPITTHAIVELPLSVAKMMIDDGKAERQDPL